VQIAGVYRTGTFDFDFQAQADCITKSEFQSYRGSDGTSIAGAKAGKESRK
jgi:hypothetical protein